MVSRRLVASVVDRAPEPGTAPDPLALILLGPTASGKTALALALARHLPIEILSCDSVAVYRGMDIGSAKPTAAQRTAVPHHLLDLTDPDHDFSAGDYARAARATLHAVTSRSATPVISGGTGLYLRALVEGLIAAPPRNPELRQRLAAIQSRSQSRSQPGSPSRLHRLLTRLDPAAAARIHTNDAPKLIRAIEVTLAARRPITDLFAAGRDRLTGFRLLRIGLDPPRAALYDRINRRAAQMFSDGLLAETQSLLDRFGPVRPLDSLGYRQAAAVLRGELTEPAAIAAAQQGHRNYAKRQLTWFRREAQVHWIPDFGDSPQSLATTLALIQSQLTPT